MIRFLPLAALFFVFTASAEPAQQQLAPDTESRWVPFELTRGNQIRFTLLMNGKPASAVLDTGVSDTVVSTGFAATAGLAPGVAARAEAIGGGVNIRWTTADTLRIGGLTRRGGRIAVTELKGVAIGGGTPIDLLVGSDILSCCAIEVDYDARRFRLLPSGRMPFRGTDVPLTLARDTGTYQAEVQLAGRRVRPVIVDTGDGSALTVSRAAWEASGAVAQATTSTIAYGLGGPIETEVAVVPAVGIGAVTVRDVEVRIEDAAGFSMRTGTAGRIGTGLLQRYHLLLDPRAGHMVLAPARAASAAPRRSTSGLLLAYQPGRFRVLHVMRNSPAAAAGWKAGEEICQVDGTPVPGRVSPDFTADWTAGVPGRVVTLGLCDGSTRALTLAKFY